VRKNVAYLCLLTVCLVGSLSAQTYQGRILGLVTDPTGAVLPGAQVTIIDVATGATRTLTTTTSGEFVAPNLEPGPYTVMVEAAGFQKFQRIGLQLEVARDIRVDAALHPGPVDITVTISDEAPVINTTNDVLGSTFSNDAVNELPLQGRDFQNLVTLQPGIQREPGGGLLSITANGNRATDNNFIVDGIDDNDAYYGDTVLNEPGVTGTPATHLPIDAIQEFNVQSSPEADYGYKPGAIVNIGIKSGTNQFHGSAYYFHRNNALDARNYFNPIGTPLSALRLHQFGASGGGPIFKNKLFVFANYEGVRDIVGNPVSVDTPVTSILTNPDGSLDTEDSLASAVQACQIAGNCNPMSMNLVNYNKNGQTLFLTNPGGTADPNDIAAINTDYNNQNREDNGIVKLDFHATERHSFNATYFIGDSNQIEEDVNVAQPIWLSHADTRAQLIGGSWNFSANARFNNQLHFGYNRLWQQLFQGDHSVNPTEYGLNTGVADPLNFGMPEVRISGFMSHTLGGNVDYPLLTTPNQTYIIADSASYLKGSHNFRFGGEFRTGSTDNTRNDYGPGELRFDSLDDFVTGNPSRGYAWVGNSRRNVSQKTFGLFMQDSWRATKNLIVSYGLRYDVSFPIKEQHNLLGNFDPTLGLVQVGKQIDEPYKTDWNNVGPRLAFIYDVAGAGRTVVRVGGGMIYEVPHISIFIGQNGAEAEGLSVIPTGAAGVTPGGGTINASFFQLSGDTVSSNWQSGGPVFGNLNPNVLSCSYDQPCPILGVNKNLVVPYVWNWNANVQQAMWKNAALTIAYVGNKGTKLYSILDLNQNIYANDTEDDEQSGRPFVNKFPYLSFVDQLGNGDDSIYHGLQVTLKQQTTKGLFFVAGYTWARSIDDSSSNRGYTIQNSYNPGAERGDSDFDIRNRFTFAATYDIPGKPGYAQMLKGWRINSIFTAQSAEPVLFYDSFDDISMTGSFNDRWNLTGDPKNIHWVKTGSLPFFADGTTNPACVTADPDGVASGQLAYYGCYAGSDWTITPPAIGDFGDMGRNVVRGPDYVNLDFSTIKTFTFGDRINLELRGEFFNILNHPNLAGIDGDVSDTSSLGLARYTPDVYASNPVVGSGGSRHIQVGAKVRW
jgi:Carboxypeptidase regulatory-like domain